MMLTLLIALALITLGLTLTSLWLLRQNMQHKMDRQWGEQQSQNLQHTHNNIQNVLSTLQSHHQNQSQQQQQYQIDSLKLIQEGLHGAIQTTQSQVSESLKQHTSHLNEGLKNLTAQTQKELHAMSEVVDQRLNQSFEKTHATFHDVIKRLSIIDAAQQKITELSNNVVSLQAVLTDKSARGAFGEVQLEALIRNQMPENHYSMQHTLGNGKRVDCLLFLPEPTGNVAIDSKFPLESYQRLSANLTEAQKKVAETQFKKDVRKHIKDIADKYILPGETAAGALMFIPAESIFAHIHGQHPDLVALAQKSKVWLTSPTTLMAVLTTARAVIKDDATRKQVHIIQNHLHGLGKDFERFQKRMDGLAKHIQQAYDDVEKVHTSSKKISSKFKKIEDVNLTSEEKTTLLDDKDSLNEEAAS
jgi:DNA recombination protein RmuC